MCGFLALKPRHLTYRPLTRAGYRVQVQHVVPEVMIPPEVTPENVTTYIVDTGCASVSLARLDGSYI